MQYKLAFMMEGDGKQSVPDLPIGSIGWGYIAITLSVRPFVRPFTLS
jgi:hypothetical protein